MARPTTMTSVSCQLPSGPAHSPAAVRVTANIGAAGARVESESRRPTHPTNRQILPVFSRFSARKLETLMLVPPIWRIWWRWFRWLGQSRFQAIAPSTAPRCSLGHSAAGTPIGAACWLGTSRFGQLCVIESPGVRLPDSFRRCWDRSVPSCVPACTSTRHAWALCHTVPSGPNDISRPWLAKRLVPCTWRPRRRGVGDVPGGWQAQSSVLRDRGIATRRPWIPHLQAVLGASGSFPPACLLHGPSCTTLAQDPLHDPARPSSRP
jgi:hypothetical protein